MASQLPVKWSAFGQKLPKYKPALSEFESSHVLKKACRQRSIAKIAGVVKKSILW